MPRGVCARCYPPGAAVCCALRGRHDRQAEASEPPSTRRTRSRREARAPKGLRLKSMASPSHRLVSDLANSETLSGARHGRYHRWERSTTECVARLRTLTRLPHNRRTTATDLGRELPISLDIFSTSLGRLSSVDLIQRRKFGPWSYYSRDSPYRDDAISGRPAAWIRRTVRDSAQVAKCLGPGQLRDTSPDETEPQSDEVPLEAATAFAELRRLPIMRRVACCRYSGTAPS